MAISAGWDYNIAMKSDGTVVGWGFNTDNQCNEPPGTYSMLEAGAYHVLALTPIPEPSMALILGLGGAVFLRRKR